MAILRITVLLFFSNLASGQWQWARDAESDTSFTLPPSVQITASCTDANGNTYITGYMNSVAVTFGNMVLINPGYFIAKYDSTGNAVWAQNGPDHASSQDICTDAAGNVYVGGVFGDTPPSLTFGTFTLVSNGSVDLFLVKYDPSGNVLWARSGGGGGHDVVEGLSCSPGGQVVIAGKSDGQPVSFGNFIQSTAAPFVVCYDNNGNELWLKDMPGAKNRSVALNADGEVYLAGEFHTIMSAGSCASCTLTSQNNSTLLFLAKLDPFGNAIWARTATGNSNSSINDIDVDPAGNVFAVGSYSGFSLVLDASVLSNGGSSSLFLVKFDSSGLALWAARAQENSELHEGDYVTVDPLGDVYVSGTFWGPLGFGSNTLMCAGHTDIFIAKYTSSGSPVWSVSAGGSNYDMPAGLGSDATGNVYSAGVLNDVTFGSIPLPSGVGGDYVVKYSTSGGGQWAAQASETHLDNYTLVVAENIVADGAGNVYVSGAFNQKSVSFGSHTLINAGPSGDTSDIFLVKYSPTGAVLWAKSFGSQSYNTRSSLAIDQQGNVYLAGNFSDASISIDGIVVQNVAPLWEEGFVFKIDPLGNTLWGRSIGGTRYDLLTGIATDNYGNVLIAGLNEGDLTVGGVTLAGDPYEQRMFVSKLGSTGNLIWMRQSSPLYDYGKVDVATDIDGNVFVSGGFMDSVSFSGNTYATTLNGFGKYLVKYDVAGTALWATTAPYSPNRLLQLETDAAGDIYLLQEKRLSKYNTFSVPVWNRTFGDGKGMNLSTTANGNILVVGNFQTQTLTLAGTSLTNTGVNTPFVVCYDGSGSALWARSGGTNSIATSVAQGLNSDVYISGFFEDSVMVLGADTLRSYLQPNMFVASMADPLGIEQTYYSNSNSFDVYPNPFSRSTTLKVERPFRNADLTVHNSLGQIVHQMNSLSGKTVNINRDDLVAGIYFFNLLENGRAIASGKLVIVD